MRKRTKEYYIAYFDILGYKAFFSDKENDIQEFLKFNIDMTRDILKKKSENWMLLDFDVKLKMFSDNYMFLVEVKQDTDEYQIVKSLSYFLALLQLRFLEKYKIIVRGVITKGEIYADDHVLFGEGVIRAHEKEGYANFPRVIIDAERIDKTVCDDLCEKCISIDEDGEYYIDFFDILGSGIGTDDEFIDEEENHLKVIRQNIISLLRKYGKYNRRVTDKNKIDDTDKTISKYAWLLSKFNKYCEFYYEHYQIPYKLTLYYRLMKCEIEV